MNLIRNLRNKSEEEKKVILIISTIVVMFFVGLLWFYLSNLMPIKYSTTENKNNVSVIDLLNGFVTEVQNDIEKGI